MYCGARAGHVDLRELSDQIPDYLRCLRRDVCAYCGRRPTSKAGHTLDHIVPRAARGSGGWENMTPACADCNQAKANRPLLLALLDPAMVLDITERKARRRHEAIMRMKAPPSRAKRRAMRRKSEREFNDFVQGERHPSRFV